jgi:leucyl aminopeptidase
VDAATNGALARAMTASGASGAAGRITTVYNVGAHDVVLLVGVGSAPLSRFALEELGGRAVQALERTTVSRASLLWQGVASAVPDAAAHVATGATLGSYAFADYRKTKPAAKPEPQITLRTADAASAAARFARDGAALDAGVTFARDIITIPSNLKYPESFVDAARKAFTGVKGVEIEVLDVPAMQKLGMGGMLGVGQGSVRPPRLLVVRYSGAARDSAPVAFVGKGITFDTGGISLKDPDGMWDMKYDMAGAAASVGAVLTLAKREARVNAVAIAALAENMPDGNAIRPGDVLTTMSGKTIEVLNTDAEGRVVLADAVWYAQDRFRPRALATIATLTGSIRTALGDDFAGLYTRQDDVAAEVSRAGTTAGEPVWRMPFHPSLDEDIKSEIADVRNIALGAARSMHGAGIGAAFIGTWVKPETRWAHLDIAGMAWVNADRPTVPSGAVGYGVRLFDQWVRDAYEGK